MHELLLSNSCSPAQLHLLLRTGCRQVSAELLQQLHEQQTLQQQRRQQQWEAAYAGWGTLHSQHAVLAFCDVVRTTFAEPEPRQALFAQLRSSQGSAHSSLVQHCKRVGRLSPPNLNTDSVDNWVEEGKTFIRTWQQQLASYIQELTQQEEDIEQQVVQHLNSVLMSGRGYSTLV